MYPCDLTDDESVEALVEEMLKEQAHGHRHAGQQRRPVDPRSVQLCYDRFHDYERAMAINYFGAVRLILALLPHMTERRFGHVVNVSSIGVQGTRRGSRRTWRQGGAGLFRRIVATENHGDGITFTTVHMPLVRTPMIGPTKHLRRVPDNPPSRRRTW